MHGSLSKEEVWLLNNLFSRLQEDPGVLENQLSV